MIHRMLATPALVAMLCMVCPGVDSTAELRAGGACSIVRSVRFHASLTVKQCPRGASWSREPSTLRSNVRRLWFCHEGKFLDSKIPANYAEESLKWAKKNAELT